MINCLDDLIKSIPREYSGSSTSASYDFQKNWGICLLLENHKREDDYLIFFDYHEDIIHLDSSIEPQFAYCYQIKNKKSGNWTIPSITKQNENKKTKEKSSIIGKLFSNRSVFSDRLKELYFVSNAFYKVDLTNGESSTSKVKICLNELAPNERVKLTERLSAEYNGDLDEMYDITFLKRTDLPFDNSDTYVKGLLSEFFEDIQPDLKYNIGLVYKTLFDEVKRKTNYSFRISEKDDLRKKSISKGEFESILTSYISKPDMFDLFQKVENRLNCEHVSMKKIIDLKTALGEINVKKMDKTNTYISFLENESEEFMRREHEYESLIEISEYFYENIIARYPEYNFINKNEILVLGMVKLYE